MKAEETYRKAREHSLSLIEEYNERLATVQQGFDDLMKNAEDLTNAWLYEIAEEARTEFERDYCILHANVIALIDTWLVLAKAESGISEVQKKLDGSRRQGK